MNEVGINDGDLLIVDKSINPKNLSTVIANVNEELVVKTFLKEKGNNYLRSGQNKVELNENPSVIIWGVVTYVIHKLY